MARHLELIREASEIRDLVGVLSQETMISFDTEFIRESTFFPMIEILQVATATDSWLIDARYFKNKDPEGIQPLLDVFADPKILKIVHAAQGDQEVLFASYGRLASPTLDTAVAASLLGMGDSLGLGNLLKQVLGIQLKKGHARTDWSVRPLPEQLADYALSDVDHLVDAAQKLLAQLEEQGRKDWALEICKKWEDPKLFEPQPEELAEKLARGGRLDGKSYGAMIELVRWRENRVRELNLPRRWVADDQVLVDLANVRPKDLKHLGAFRGLNKGELQKNGEKILEAIRVGSENPIHLPKGERRQSPSDLEEQALGLLKVYIALIAEKKNIAPKHLAQAGQLLGLLRSQATSVEQMIQEGSLSPVAAQMIGQEILDFRSGRVALGIRDGAIQLIPAVQVDRESV